MMADFNEGHASATFRHPKDAQPPRFGAFAAMGRRPILPRGLGAESPSTSMIVATQSLLAKLIITRHRNINHLQRNHLFVLVAKLVVVFQNHINEFSAIDASYNRNTGQILLRILRVV